LSPCLDPLLIPTFREQLQFTSSGLEATWYWIAFWRIPSIYAVQWKERKESKI